MGRLSTTFLFGTLLTALVILFQNCGGFASERVEASLSGGNGEPYGGKPEVFYAFSEGFTCQDSAGANIPSPLMVIEKAGEIYTLKKSACVPKNEVLPPSAFSLGLGTVDYDFRRFQPAVPVTQFLGVTYQFVETHCTETLVSRLMRRYGSPMLSPEEMTTAVADSIETLVYSTYYGVRRASVIVSKDAPVQTTSSTPIEKVSYIIPELFMTLAVNSVEYTRSNPSEFTLTASRPATAPPGGAVNYVATLEMTWAGASYNNIELSCAVYPH